MAFTPNQNLGEPTTLTLRSWQHASRLFVDDQFRLAPKHTFNFHVSFSINRGALFNIDLAERYKTEINMLVKSADLPKFAIQTETLNQYNRKKIIQYTHKYEDITVTFHDDNMGLITNLWSNYYSYYFADPNSAPVSGSFSRNATRHFDFTPTSYGLDNGSTLPFFNSITIYQMARHEWVSYTLYNPIIKTFNHAKVKYEGSGVAEHTMTLGYEAVSYDSGEVGTEFATASSSNPTGFGTEHYDQHPSPLQGIPDPTSLRPTLTNQKNVTDNKNSFLGNLIQTVNGYNNTSSQQAPASNTGVVSPVATNNPGGLQGVVFPVAQVPPTTTKGIAHG